MYNVILTGGTGFIGRNMIRRLLLDPECEIYAVVRPDSKNISLLPASERVHVVKAELSELERSLDAFPERCDAFYHFAWGGVNRQRIDDPTAQQENVTRAMCCVRAAKMLHCEVFIDAGSCAEYGRIDGPYSEGAVCQPITAYGKTKLAYCQEAQKCLSGSGTRYIHGRIFSVYGPYDHPWSLICSGITKMLRDEPIDLGSCRHMWNYMYIDDACDLMITLYQERFRIPIDDNGIFNVATRDIRPLREFVEEMRMLTNSRSELRFGTFSPKNGNDFSILPDMDKVERILGWRPSVDFATGIRKTIDELER